MTVSSEENPIRTKRSLKDELRHAFAVGDEYSEKLVEDELSLLSDIAGNIHRRGLTVVAIPFLLFHRPLNVIGANLLQMGEFFLNHAPVEEFLRRFMGPKYTHELLVRTLEKRRAIDHLVELLEAKLD
jgi:hypothetical protein